MTADGRVWSLQSRPGPSLTAAGPQLAPTTPISPVKQTLQVAIPGPFEEKPVVDWGPSLKYLKCTSSSNAWVSCASARVTLPDAVCFVNATPATAVTCFRAAGWRDSDAEVVKEKLISDPEAGSYRQVFTAPPRHHRAIDMLRPSVRDFPGGHQGSSNRNSKVGILWNPDEH